MYQIAITHRKGKKLVRTSYDNQGNKVIERGRRWYRAETPLGEIVEFDSKPNRALGRAVNSKNLVSNSSKTKRGFDKMPENIYTGNVGGKLRKEMQELRDKDVLWKVNQRECLRRMLVMTNYELYVHLIAWNQLTQQNVLDTYGIEILSEDIAKVGTESPTMIQLSSITMVKHAQENPKFGLTILELLEGKAISYSTLEEKESKAKASNETSKKTSDELGLALEKLKQNIFSETSDESVVDVEDTSVVDVEDTADVDLEGNALLDSLINGG